MLTETDRWLAEGQALVAHKDYALALVPLNRIVRQTSTGAIASKAWRLKSDALAGLGHLEQAYDAADQAAQAEPDSLAALTQRARRALRVSRFTEAIADFERVLQRTPDDAEMWSELGDTYRCASQSPEAVAAYDHALALNAELASAWYGKAKEAERLGKSDEALVDYLRAVDRSANDAELHVMALVGAGLILTNARRLDEAFALVEQAQQASEAPPAERARAFGLGAYIRNQQERYADALALSDVALALEPTSADAWHAKGWALRHLGRVDEAVAAYDEALRLDPINREIQTHRQFARAHALSERMPPLDPHDPAFLEIDDLGIWSKEARYFIGWKRYREAEVATSQMLRLYPRKVSIRLIIAVLQAHQRRYHDAWQTVQQIWRRPASAHGKC